jgi:hypothetical protein
MCTFFLKKHKLSNPLGKYQGTQLLNHITKTTLNFARNCQIVFQSDCTILHFH